MVMYSVIVLDPESKTYNMSRIIQDKIVLDLDSQNKWFVTCYDCGYESGHFNLKDNAVSSQRGHLLIHLREGSAKLD
jgi:hypothetical protein